MQKIALVAVDTVAMPLHIGLTLGSNILNAAADGVALGEGYLTEKIDNRQDREDVANARVNYTQEQFRVTAERAKAIKDKLQRTMDSANNKIAVMTGKQENIVVESEDASMNMQHPVENNVAEGSNGTLIYQPGAPL